MKKTIKKRDPYILGLARGEAPRGTSYSKPKYKRTLKHKKRAFD